MFRVVPFLLGAPAAPASATRPIHALNGPLAWAAVIRLADADRMTLPPTKTLVILMFVLAFIALLSGHPLVAAGFVTGSLLLAGFAAVVQEAPLVSAAWLTGTRPALTGRRGGQRRRDRAAALVLLAIARRLLRR